MKRKTPCARAHGVCGVTAAMLAAAVVEVGLSVGRVLDRVARILDAFVNRLAELFGRAVFLAGGQWHRGQNEPGSQGDGAGQGMAKHDRSFRLGGSRSFTSSRRLPGSVAVVTRSTLHHGSCSLTDRSTFFRPAARVEGTIDGPRRCSHEARMGGPVLMEATRMRRVTAVLTMGVCFSVGMMVPLVGLHATEDFRRLDGIQDMVVFVVEDVTGMNERPRRTDAGSSRGIAASASPAPQPSGQQVAHALPAEPGVSPAAAGPVVAAAPAETRLSGATRTGRPAPVAKPEIPQADTQTETVVEAARVSEEPQPAISDRTDSKVTSTLDAADIAEIQALLLARGYDAGAIDGVSGPQTRRAIRAFERDAGLPVSGEARPALLARLAAVDTADNEFATVANDRSTAAAIIEPDTRPDLIEREGITQTADAGAAPRMPVATQSRSVSAPVSLLAR